MQQEQNMGRDGIERCSGTMLRPTMERSRIGEGCTAYGNAQRPNPFASEKTWEQKQLLPDVRPLTT